MTYPIHIFLSNVFCKQVITSFTAFQVMPKETSCQFHSTFCSISEVLQWITSIICINEFSQTIRIYFHHSRFVHIQNVTKIKGKLWRVFLVMLRNRMQTRNYRFVWGILCSSCRCASSQWRHSWKIWIFALKPCLLFSTLLMTFADSHHWLHCQKSGIKNDGWDPPFFRQWRHPSEMSMTSLEIIS